MTLSLETFLLLVITPLSAAFPSMLAAKALFNKPLRLRSSRLLLLSGVVRRHRRPIISMSALSDDADENYSLDHLHERMSAFLENHDDDDSNDSLMFAVALAGGGSHFLSTLTSTPGASRVFLEGNILYDRNSFQDYSSMQNIINNNNNNNKINNKTNGFRYVSPEASASLGQAALQRALSMTARTNSNYVAQPVLSRMQAAMGVAMTSQLVSNTSTTTINNRTASNNHTTSSTTTSTTTASQAHAMVTRSDGSYVTLQATLTPQQRSRREEDVFVSHILLTCLEEALKPDEYENTGNSSASNMNELASSEHPTTVSTTTATTKFGDVLQLSRSARPTTIQQRLFDAANRILIDNEPCVMLFGKDFIPSALPVLPPNSVIVPGSFHPLHHGHVALAKAALEAAKGSVIFFELSLVNADKPSLQANQVVQRLQTFLTLQKELLELDQRWGILLTNAPLFVDKVQLLEPFQAHGVDSENDRLNFVIGTDTLVRLVDPKYYGGSSEAMLETISSMPCQFVVGGRLEQKKGTDKHEPAVFVTGQETVDALPQVLQEKFIVLPDFRVDISSTELREKMAKQ